MKIFAGMARSTNATTPAIAKAMANLLPVPVKNSRDIKLFSFAAL